MTSLVSLATLLVFCLFYKIVTSSTTKYVTESLIKINYDQVT